MACSCFAPTPSLAAMLVNRFKFREDVLTYNLAGMGCSTSVVAVDMAKHLLSVSALMLGRPVDALLPNPRCRPASECSMPGAWAVSTAVLSPSSDVGAHAGSQLSWIFPKWGPAA